MNEQDSSVIVPLDGKAVHKIPDVSRTSVSHQKLAKVDWRNKLFRDFNARDTSFEDCDFRYSIFDRAYFRNTKFINCRFDGARFSECNLKTATFYGCDLKYALFQWQPEYQAHLRSQP